MKSIVKSIFELAMLSTFIVQYETALRRVPPFMLAFVTAIIGSVLGFVFTLFKRESSIMDFMYNQSSCSIVAFFFAVSLLGLAQIILIGMMSLYFRQIAIAASFCIQPAFSGVTKMFAAFFNVVFCILSLWLLYLPDKTDY